jgi:hypothetical protein
MSRHGSASAWPRRWLSGVISDPSSDTPDELGLCAPLWSTPDLSFSCRPGLYLSPRSTIDDFDTVLLDALFDRLACLSRRKSFFTSLDLMEHPLHFLTVSEYLENLIPDGCPMVRPLCHEMIQGIDWSSSLDENGDEVMGRSAFVRKVR